MNHFSYKSAAERYAKGRPHFHPQIIGRIGAYLSISRPVVRAIDVGCGTGLSTIALKSLAENVVGADLSHAMIALAPSQPNISYLGAPAEQLPFADESFDLMTISQAFHWINRDDFLAAAHRVLRKDAWLIVYDNRFSGQMEENPKFSQWAEEYYEREYPSPRRASIDFTSEDAEKAGFLLSRQETYPNSNKFSLEGFVSYLMTHSNVIAVVEGGVQSADDVRSSLRREIAPFFENRTEATFGFHAPIWYLQKVG